MADRAQSFVSKDFKNFANRYGIPLATTEDKETRNNLERAATAGRVKAFRTMDQGDKDLNPSRERLKTAITLHREQRMSRMHKG